jgi:hypothetical protein
MNKDAYAGLLIAEIACAAGKAIGLIYTRSVRGLGLFAGVSPVEATERVLGSAPCGKLFDDGCDVVCAIAQ